MRGHLGRVLIAVLLLPILYWIIRYGPPYGFFLLVVAGILSGQYEFYRLYYPQDHILRICAGLALGFLLALSFYLETIQQSWPSLLSILTLIVLGVLLFSLLTTQEVKAALSDSAVTLFSVLYVSLLLSHLLFLRGMPDGELLILFVVGITWLGDAAAYYVGTLAGRHALAPRISPKKTIEGAAGGLAVSVAGSVAAKFWFLPALSIADSVRVGILLGVMGQIGDLVESLWKRSAGRKDSGTLLFAHGGILDKLDSLIFAAPAFYYYLVWVM